MKQMNRKVERIINLYSRLMDGEAINKNKEAIRFGVNGRTIQRDIDDIRTYFANDMDVNKHLVYDWGKKGYVLQQNTQIGLRRNEIFMICKVLLGSRALAKEEMVPIIDKLLRCCISGDEQKKMTALIANERFHYQEREQSRPYESIVWEIAEAAYEHRYVQIDYQKEEASAIISRRIQPIGILYSEGYFYLAAYILMGQEKKQSQGMKEAAATEEGDGRLFPAVYRLDCVVNYKILEERFRVSYGERFEESEFRKRFHPGMDGEGKIV